MFQTPTGKAIATRYSCKTCSFLQTLGFSSVTERERERNWGEKGKGEREKDVDYNYMQTNIDPSPCRLENTGMWGVG